MVEVKLMSSTFYFFGFETGFLCVSLADLVLSIDQAGLELIEIHLLLSPKCWD